MQGITLLRTPVRAEFCFFRRVKIILNHRLTGISQIQFCVFAAQVPCCGYFLSCYFGVARRGRRLFPSGRGPASRLLPARGPELCPAVSSALLTGLSGTGREGVSGSGPPVSGVPVATNGTRPPLPPIRPQVDDIVGTLDHIQVMLDHDHGVARITSFLSTLIRRCTSQCAGRWIGSSRNIHGLPVARRATRWPA